MNNNYEAGYDELYVAITRVLPLLKHAQWDIGDAVKLLEEKLALCDRNLDPGRAVGRCE